MIDQEVQKAISGESPEPSFKKVMFVGGSDGIRTDADRLGDVLSEIYPEAKKHGIGVVIFNQPGDLSG